jgi:phage terminase small subunit
MARRTKRELDKSRKQRPARTPRGEALEALFASEYAKDRNGTQAYIRAVPGTQWNRASVAACNMLKKGSVQSLITEKLQAVIENNDLSVERVLEEVRRIALANKLDYGEVMPNGKFRVDLSRTTRAQMSAVQEVQSEEYVDTEDKDNPHVTTVRNTRIKLHDKPNSLKLLMQYYKLLTDKLEFGAVGGGALVPPVINVNFRTVAEKKK